MKIKNLIFLIFFPFLLGAVSRPPASTHWEHAFYGGNGAFMTVLVDNEYSNILYGLCDVSGILKSKDSGDNWDFVNSGITSVVNEIVAQSPVSPNILYILGAVSQKSVDRGETWQPTGTELTVDISNRAVKNIAFHHKNKDIVYFALNNGQIKKTIDGGQTFTTFATLTGVRKMIQFLAIDENDRYMYVGSLSNGMLRFDLSDGTSIPITFTGTNANYSQDYAFYKQNNIEYFCVGTGNYISCSNDNGITWTQSTDIRINTPFETSTEFYIYRFALKVLNNGNLNIVAYARRTNTPYGENIFSTSNDNGITWTNVWYGSLTIDPLNYPGNEYGFGVIGNIYFIVADQHIDGTFYLTTDGGISKSIDGGLTWIQKNKGLQSTVLSDIAFSPDGKYTFAAGMDLGLVKSDDHGITWHTAIPHGPNADVQGFGAAGHYWQVVTLGTEADWLAGIGGVVATSNWWIDSLSRVVVSQDNGTTWQVITSGLPTTLLRAPATWSSTKTYQVGDNVAVADGIYTCILTNVGNNPTNGANPTYWTLYRQVASTNVGNWGDGLVRGLTKAPNDILYLCIDGYSLTENGGIFKSVDKGLNWTRTTQPAQWGCYNGISADPTDATGQTVGFVEWFKKSPANPLFFKSTDGGLTWTSGVTTTLYGNFDLAYASNGFIYSVGSKGFPTIAYSTNGNTWYTMKSLNERLDIIGDAILVDPSDPNTLYVGVNDGTSDGIKTDTGFVQGGSVYMTNNALAGTEATWINIDGDLPCYSGIQSLAINEKEGTHGYLYAATDGCGVFKLNLDPTAPITVEGVYFE